MPGPVLQAAHLHYQENLQKTNKQALQKNMSTLLSYEVIDFFHRFKLSISLNLYSCMHWIVLIIHFYGLVSPQSGKRLFGNLTHNIIHVVHGP